MKKFVSLLLSICFVISQATSLEAELPLGYSFDTHVLNWVRSNISPVTQLPYSFYIPEQAKNAVYRHMDASGALNGAIERTITKEGLDIYDGAVYQIVLSMVGGQENLRKAFIPFDDYWQGVVGLFNNIRSGYPINLFIYDAKHPDAVSSDNNRLGERGFIFRIIDADGNYSVTDPMNGGRSHWMDWKPVAGENAWVVIAAMQLYHKKFFDLHPNSVELRLSKELARAAMMLQSQSGGIRMAPLGTYRDLTAREKEDFTRDNWWYNHISTENNISWYAAFRMLYEVTGDTKYKKAMDGIETYLHFVWNKKENMFYQGACEIRGQWLVSKENFALDVQSWAIDCLGPRMLDTWFGPGTSYHIWQTAKKYAGVFDARGNILGVGYTNEHDRISVEWSAGAMVALEESSEYYMKENPVWSEELHQEKLTIRRSMETLHYKISGTSAAYSYSSRRGWIPFGWNSHDPQVMSLASTGWMMFVDAGVNPFRFIPLES